MNHLLLFIIPLLSTKHFSRYSISYSKIPKEKGEIMKQVTKKAIIFLWRCKNPKDKDMTLKICPFNQVLFGKNKQTNKQVLRFLEE